MAPPSGGTMAPLAGIGGSGGVMPPPQAGTASPPPPGDPQCGGSLQCVSGVCTDPATNSPPTCTAGGTECASLTGSACVLGAGGSPGICSKACGEAAMFQCPAPLTCMDPFAMSIFICVDGFLPPPCTIGGTECDAFGLTCSTATGITACWRTCTP